MKLPVLDMSITGAVVVLMYDGGTWGPATAEFDLVEYSATRPGKNGRAEFVNVTRTQWRVLCREIISARCPQGVDAIIAALARYVSPAALDIYREEYRKAIEKRYTTTDAGRGIQELNRRLADFAPTTLDALADKLIKILTLDEFAIYAA